MNDFKCLSNHRERGNHTEEFSLNEYVEEYVERLIVYLARWVQNHFLEERNFSKKKTMLLEPRRGKMVNSMEGNC